MAFYITLHHQDNSQDIASSKLFLQLWWWLVITYISQSPHTTSCREGARKLEANSSVLLDDESVDRADNIDTDGDRAGPVLCLISPGGDCRLS